MKNKGQEGLFSKGTRTELLSRYGTVNSFLTLVYEWSVPDDTQYRISFSENDNDEIYMLDPDGGPCIRIGTIIDGREVQRITKLKDSNDKIKYLLYVK